MEQAAVLLFEEPMTVVRNGLTVFFFLIALMLIFGLTVFLLPVSLGIFILLQVVIWLGEVAIAIAAGYLLATRLLKRSFHTGYMVGALVCIGLIKCIPYVSLPLTFIFMPLLSLGLVTTAIINGWVKRRYYETPFSDIRNKKRFDFSAIRGMILKDI